MGYYAEDTKGEGNLYELISNYLQDAQSEKQQSIEPLVFFYPSGEAVYKSFQFHCFKVHFQFEFYKNAHIFH